MKKQMMILAMSLTAAMAFGDPNPYADYGEGMKSTKENPSAVDWSKANDAMLSAGTAPAKLAAYVANERAARALLAQVNGAYDTDPISACQIAAVTQWVMLPDPWYCLWWDGDHAAGRKIWVEALLARIETASDDYARTFCLDQLRWCGCDCSKVLDRLRAIYSSCGSKAVSEMTAQVLRELEKKSVGISDSSEVSEEECYAETIDEGFVSLFNGQDLTGWTGSKMYGVETIEIKLNNGTVKKENVLACFPDRKAEGDCGNLLTEKEYRNFILRFEFVMPENGNNGLGIRTPSADVDAAYFGMCELQLLDDGGSAYYDKTAKKDKLQPYQYTGSIYGVVPSLRDNVGKQIWGKDANFTGGGSYVRKPGMWNFEEVKVIGSEIEVWLNGYLITKGDVTKFKGDGDTPDGRKHPGLHNEKGRLGWLGHGHHVMWKNIRIKELPDDAKMGCCACGKAVKIPGTSFTPYFTGCPEQLKTMWKGVTTEENFDNPIVRQAATPEKRVAMQKIADVGRDAHWSVLPNGVLHFDGYKGGYSLATAKDLRDFELWADWRTLSITGDSGLYLRGSPQVQIWDAHNQWGIGSGGLYNNQKNPSQALKIADRPVGDWNRFHVIMKGEKVTVYLNGELVVDNVTLENYWDRAKPIFPVEQLELQCHGDPTEWRNIFIREL